MNVFEAAIAALALSAILSSTPVEAQGSELSAEERASLTRGEMIRRTLQRRDRAERAFGGISMLRIEAPVDVVWEAASDPEALTELIPTLASARVVEERNGERLIFMHHSYGVGETDYYLRMVLDSEHHQLSFEIDASRPHDVRSGHGFMQLRAHDGGTIVTWGMQMVPGVGILGELFASALDAWLLKPPLCLRDVVTPGPRPSC